VPVAVLLALGILVPVLLLMTAPLGGQRAAGGGTTARTLQTSADRATAAVSIPADLVSRVATPAASALPDTDPESEGIAHLTNRSSYRTPIIFPTLPELGQREYLTLRAKGTVPVYGGPGQPIARTFPAALFGSAPTTFLAVDKVVGGDGNLWYEAYQPVRPNMKRVWIRSDDVDPIPVRTAIVVIRGTNRLTLYESGQKIASYPVCVGKAGSPTPEGDFSIVVRVKPGNPEGAYGPLALGLSAYSDVLTDWPGGGQVGIHGTNNPSSIGEDVSHGCIRLHNEDILALGAKVQLGTPVFIR
jgi:L,D-transpeptidase catalytic domain